MTKRNKTILIIESDLSLRCVLRMAMDCEGHKVLEAESEKVAKEILKKISSPVDCILNRVSARPGSNVTNFGNIPVISPPEGLLSLDELHTAISQI